MPRNEPRFLWDALSAAGRLSERFLDEPGGSILLDRLLHGSCFGGRLEEFRGRNVLVATDSQTASALAFIELDGVARRMVLCPPDLPLEHIPFVVSTAAIDAVVADHQAGGALSKIQPAIVCSLKIPPVQTSRTGSERTEWILMTSGTTGPPKMVVHTLNSLTGAIGSGSVPNAPVVWSTFYDIRRYGGLQIFFRALIGGGSLVLSDAREPVSEFLARARQRGVTHILGTPTHWRTALMSPAARRFAPKYVRLSGEIADQAVLDHLRAFYPDAEIVHAYASTEAGVGFEVKDGLAGFPAHFVDRSAAGVDIKIEEATLRIRSKRNAAGYLGGDTAKLSGADGYVDTGDVVERRGDRYYFAGRKGGIINVGGLKVHPEEVEAVINAHPKVRMSLVRARRSSLTGALVVADVVLNPEDRASPGQDGALKSEILAHCGAILPRHKIPTAINFVDSLELASTGKIARHHA